jgi:hypothetical protein
VNTPTISPDLQLQLDDIIGAAHALELSMRGLRAIADEGVNEGHYRGLDIQAFELRRRIEDSWRPLRTAGGVAGPVP